MSVESNFEIICEDPFRNVINGVSGSCYSFNISYEEPADTHNNYNKLNRGKDITITYPVECAAELDRLQHLNVQAAAHNQENYTTPILEKRIDEIAIELADLCFKSESRKVTDFCVYPRHIYALLIHDVLGMSSFGDLTKHLLENKMISDTIGYEEPTKQRNYYRIDNKLKNRGQRRIISNAAKRIVHGMWRNGYPLPKKITSEWRLDVEPLINISNINPSTRRAAICNWMEYLLPKLVHNITFNRNNNKIYSISKIIGSLAQAALINGCYSSELTAGWHYNDDELIGGRQLSNLMSKVDTERISEMFQLVNDNFINIASDLGFFHSGYNYAADTTWIDHYGDGMAEVINNPEECNTGIGLCYGAVSIMEQDARFAVGIDVVYDKKNTVDEFSDSLINLHYDHAINGIYMDREFSSGKGVQTCRMYTDKWVIRTKISDEGEIREKYDETSEGDSFGPKKVDFAGIKPKPQLYIHPIDDEEHPADTNDTHMLYLVGDGFDQDDGQDIHDTYRSRWSIETYFRQLKHDFSPKSKTNDINERLFLINIGQFFYNVHTLINRVPSPRYGLPLDIPYYMVLKGIVEYTFTREAAFVQ